MPPIFKLSTGERWRPQPVETVERLGRIGGKPINLDHLPPEGRMDFPDNMRDPTDTPAVGYYRKVRAANLWWHQYWLWYLYNPWAVAGVGRHEGDWEFVQVGCTDRFAHKPVLVTASQHKGGERREYWRCQTEHDRLVIYAALGSHANFFTPGDRGQDTADGRGLVLDNIEWRDFGDWARWEGRWGNSTGTGRSPESPACQGERWHAPHLYHAAAR
jgi:hypothetical protein